MDAHCFMDEDAACQRQLNEERIWKDLEDKGKQVDRDAWKCWQKEKQLATQK
jgi:hypothetical protein